MGASASVPANENGEIRIAMTITEEHLAKYRELEFKLKESENVISDLTSEKNLHANLLEQERDNNKSLHRRALDMKNKISSLESELAASKRAVSNLTRQLTQTAHVKDVEDRLARETEKGNETMQILITERKQNKNSQHALMDKCAEVNLQKDQLERELKEQLKTQNVYIQETLDKLTNQIKHVEDKLAQDTKVNRKSIQTLKKQCTEVKTQRDQLKKDLIQLKKSKHFAIQVALDDLNKRVEAISRKILENVKSNNRETYKKNFHALKGENDRMIKDLTIVTFTSRLYQNHCEELLKLQDENDKTCIATVKTIHDITKECKMLMNEYNSTFPDTFQKAIDNHTKDLDTVEKVNISSGYAKEETVQEKILSALSKERAMLENILRAEKDNHHHKDGNDKRNNLRYINNLDRNDQSFDLVVYNMTEASDHLADIVSFETFLSDITGRKIQCTGLQRLGDTGKTPRAAKITLKSESDCEDVLQSKVMHFERYGRIRVAKFDPEEKKVEINVS